MAQHVFLLHGLGAHPITLWPLEQYLKWATDATHTHRLSYPVDTLAFDDMIDYVDCAMLQLADKTRDTVVLIGQSMGGLVANNMWRRGWDITNAIYIGAPLHGARFIEQVERGVPRCLRRPMYKHMYKDKPYTFLKTKEREVAPPHKYHAITMAWPFLTFDGCVYTDEAVLDADADHHTHLAWADHRSVFANPRLWRAVANVM